MAHFSIWPLLCSLQNSKLDEFFTKKSWIRPSGSGSFLLQRQCSANWEERQVPLSNHFCHICFLCIVFRNSCRKKNQLHSDWNSFYQWISNTWKNTSNSTCCDPSHLINIGNYPDYYENVVGKSPLSFPLEEITGQPTNKAFTLQVLWLLSINSEGFITFYLCDLISYGTECINYNT